MALKGEVRFGVAAYLDRSVDVVFGNVEKRAMRARDAVNRSLGGVSRGAYRGIEAESGRAANRQISDARRAEREIEREFAKRVRVAEAAMRTEQRLNDRGLREQVRAREKAAREGNKLAAQTAREQERQMTYYHRAAQQSQLRRMRDEERAQDKANAERRSFAYRVGFHGITRYAPGALNRGARVANDILRGAGVDLSVGGAMARNVSLQSAAVGLAGQERIGTGGKSRGPAFYENLARGIGSDLRIGPERAVEMLRAFTAKTGEFQVGIDQLKSMSSVALASGANFDEFGSAAGYVYNQLKGMPDAGGRTVAVMRGIVGQTAVGAVEMEEYAKQMGRIAANAHMMEGQVDTNIMTMSALAQFVVERGGGTGGADAARSLNSLMTTPQKGARAKAFKRNNVELYTDKSQTKLRNIVDIIKDSISQTGGSLPKLNEMWMDVLGAKSVKGLSGAYGEAANATPGTAAEKDAAGRKAIDASLDKYMKAQLDKKAEDENIKAHRESNAAKAQMFQQNLDKIVATMAQRVIPALENLAEPALKVADGLARMVAWSAENPLKAVSIALFAGIVRAAAESAARLALERTLGGAGRGAGAGSSIITGGGGGGIVSGRGGSIRQRVNGVLAPGSAAGALMAVGGGLVGGMSGLSAAQAAGAQSGSLGGMSAQIGAGGIGGLLMGGPLGALVGLTVGSASTIHDNVTGTMGGYDAAWEGVKSFFSGDGFFQGMNRQLDKNAYAEADKRAASPQATGGPLQVKAEVDQTPTVQAVNGLASRTLNVNVTNFPAPGSDGVPPRVDSAGRQPAL